ncbi:hypothetical protein [Paenibacillus solani]|uniref:hypothetical protein n=1 Tax=Paenibacillus solani TaxID=1705565 RepID=UPI003D29CD14
MNGKLIDYYSIEYQPMKVTPIEVEEIDYRYLPELIKDLEVDFIMKDEAKEQELEILDFEEVVEIMGRTVRDCLAIPMKNNAFT